MSIQILCYCSKETVVPESFCGEEMTCSNCQQRYVLPRRWRDLGRPMLDLDLQPDEWVTIVCECHNPMDVPTRFAGRRISCEECGAIHGVPEIHIPESNATGQDIEAVRTSIELEAQRSASHSEVRYPTDDASASASRTGSGSGSRVAARVGSGGPKSGAGKRPTPPQLPEPQDDYDEYDDEDEYDDAPDGEDLPFITCKRCKAEFVETDPYCPDCGAHPATGLTHPDPDAQDAFQAFQRSGGRRQSGRAGATRGSGRTLSRGKAAGGASRGKTRTGGKSIGKSGGANRRKTASGGGASGTSSGTSGSGKAPRPRSGGGARARSGSFQRPDRKRRGNR